MKKSLLLVIAIGSLGFAGCGGGSATPHQAATHFSVTTASANVAAGIAFSITVSALDATNNVVSSYSGTAHFTSSDSQAALPNDSVLTGGTRSFQVTLNKVTSPQAFLSFSRSKTSSWLHPKRAQAPQPINRRF